MAILIQKKKGANATVTMVHTGTKDMAEITRQADIVIAAMGTPGHNGGHGQRRRGGHRRRRKPGGDTQTPTKKSGFRLVGDTDFEAIKEKAKAITPVPGGVGPMTITMLMVNTVRRLSKQLERKKKKANR